MIVLALLPAIASQPYTAISTLSRAEVKSLPNGSRLLWARVLDSHSGPLVGKGSLSSRLDSS